MTTQRLNSENESQIDLAYADFKVYTLHDMAKMFRVSLHSIHNWMDSYTSFLVIIGTIAYVPEKQSKECLANHQIESLKREGGIK